MNVITNAGERVGKTYSVTSFTSKAFAATECAVFRTSYFDVPYLHFAGRLRRNVMNLNWSAVVIKFYFSAHTDKIRIPVNRNAYRRRNNYVACGCNRCHRKNRSVSSCLTLSAIKDILFWGRTIHGQGGSTATGFHQNTSIHRISIRLIALALSVSDFRCAPDYFNFNGRG